MNWGNLFNKDNKQQYQMQANGDSGNILDDEGGVYNTRGVGNDIYYVNNAGDTITESPNQGVDVIYSTVSYTLPANVETVVLTGSANINATGNSQGGSLYGNSGSNVLNDGGGISYMVGGQGNDTYYVSNAGDIIAESSGGGWDLVYSSLGGTLAANVEALVLTGSANINATGNSIGGWLCGNTGNNVLNDGGGASQMVGGQGNDTYYVNNSLDIITENATEGTDTIYSSVSYSLPTNVESLTLTGSANIYAIGNNHGGSLYGNIGNNTFSDGGGVCTMAGGQGNDNYYVNNAGDTITESTNQGVDVIYSAVSYTLPANVETVVLTGSANINATGSSQGGSLYGNSGSNVLNDGGGISYMVGGQGNDTYYVNNAGDIIAENSGEGWDMVYSSIGGTLAANVEALVLTGSANINATGNSIGGWLCGNTGNNVLNDGGGASQMVGGQGNDTYYVNNLSDIITENANQGTDTIYSGVSYSLSANVESLILAGTGNINAIGNSQGGSLYGNSGNNGLSDGGGVCTMAGGQGNDTYYVNNADDTITESTNQGVDVIYSAVSYTLPANVETVVLTGSANINATGNSQGGSLYGNSGNNVLNDGGGISYMVGGQGNDTYYVNNAGDIIAETLNAGVDMVYSNVSYTLSANVEALVLTGSANINATGNSGSTWLYGNSGNNMLNPGTGNSFMSGGQGADTFVFGAHYGHDVIEDGTAEDVVYIGAGLTAQNLAISQSGTTLTLTGQNGESLSINNWSSNSLNNFYFADGSHNSIHNGTWEKPDHALVVGINNYQYVGPSLHQSVNDAMDFNQVLNILEPLGGDNQILVDSQATEANETQAMQNIANTVSATDDVFLYFSGHGYTAANSNVGSMCTYDSYNGSGESTSDLFTAVQNIASHLTTGHIMLAIDTCFSGTFVNALSSINHLTVMSACAWNETSGENSYLQNGIFTHYLTDGITSHVADSNLDHVITANEAFGYAQAQTVTYTSGRQNPHMYSSAGNWVLDTY